MADSSKKMQIVFASAECAPFVKTGGLGDVAGSLPAALVRAGAEVIVMVPKYATIKDEYKAQMEHFADFYVSLGWRNEYCGLEKLERDGVTYMFVDNERYFARDYPYGFFDDGERFAFFSKAITESLQHLPAGFECDILHCNDWQTALAPVFQGQFSDTVMEDILGVAHIPAAATQLRCDACSINYMLGALHYADAITTVSPTYANEIQTPEFGEGLDGVLRERSYALQGILNGIDVAGFDPATDKRIAANYTVDDRSGKAVCKAKLQEELGLEVRDDRPLMVMVTRLTRQKGMDLVMYALGLRYFQDKYPGTMAARIEFDPALSQRMYAAADMFLMPSKFEPCGLSQIIAMRYGTLPIVRETGGLKDTVIPYNEFTGEGTGFSFSNFNGDEMGDAVFRAARLFWDNREAWNQLVTQAMSQDFSWTRSADKYLDLYFFMHPEIERPAAVTEVAAVDEPAAAEAEPVATVKEPAAAEEPKAEEKPAAKAEVKPDAKPAAKKTTARKTTAKKATTTKAAASKTSAAKATTDKASTTRKRTTAAAKKAAEAEVAPEVKAEPAAKAPAKTAAKKTTATKTTTAKKATAAKSTTTKAATTKAAAKTTPKAAAKPAVKVEEAPSEPKAKVAVEAKPAAKTTTRKRATTTVKKATTKAAAPKAEAKDEDKPAVKAEPAPKAAEAKTAPKTKAKTEPAKKAPVSPAAPAEEKAPTKKTSVRKATATRKRH